MMAERDGVHCTSTLKFVRRSPSEANVSIRGVAAPLMMPPPLKPGSPQPKLSKKTRTMFGFSFAITNPGINMKTKRIVTATVVTLNFLIGIPPGKMGWGQWHPPAI
jgi:hypothetical protein